jgi:hypothetical protein
MADKEPRHRFLIRDRFALAYARSLPLCFFFRQVETSFEPASSNSNDTPNPPPACSAAPSR